MSSTFRPGPDSSRLHRPGPLLALGLMLVACGESTELPARAADSQRVPADPALAQVYFASCKLCHADPAFGAPLTDDAAVWAPRLTQGIDTLLDHSVNDYKGMPPMGMCMQRSKEQFRALIDFMFAAQD